MNIKYLCLLILSISILFSKSGKQKTANTFPSNLFLQIALKYNIYYPNVKHNAWDITCDNKNIYKWLLEKNII